MAQDERTPLRSQSWWNGGALDVIGHRSQFRMQGFAEEEFVGRPVIGILNSWSEVAGCNAHLRQLAEHVKRGVLRAGGFPVEVPVISLGEAHVGELVERPEDIRPAIEGGKLDVTREEPLARELSDFLRAVREGGRPLVTGEDGRRALKLAERITLRMGEGV